jgi:hypothetical protein
MMRVFLAGVFAVTMIFPSAVEAEFITGNTLYGWCQHNKGVAAAYVLGVADSAEVENTSDAARATGASPLICIPKNVSGEQLVDIVCRDLANQASVRHESAQTLSYVSLFLIWPCKKN